jgi:hypothetical protein
MENERAPRQGRPGNSDTSILAGWDGRERRHHRCSRCQTRDLPRREALCDACDKAAVLYWGGLDSLGNERDRRRVTR